jgi:hypothetical protein
MFKGANTPRSLIKKEFKEIEARTKYGYPEGQLNTVQPKAWMDQDHMLDWVNCVCGTRIPRVPVMTGETRTF